MEALRNIPTDLNFTKPTRFYFFYSRLNNQPAMHFCVGAVYFDCKKLKILCPTELVLQEHSPKAIMEGWTTRIEILPEDSYVVHL